MILGQERDSTSRTCCCPPAEYAGSKGCNKWGRVAIRGETTIPQFDRYRRWSEARRRSESFARGSAGEVLASPRSASANRERHLAKTKRDYSGISPPGSGYGAYP